MLLYFISFLLIVSFFVLNMFVGVVVENFHKCRQHQEVEEARRREEKRVKRMEKRRRSKRPMKESERLISFSSVLLLFFISVALVCYYYSSSRVVCCSHSFISLRSWVTFISADPIVSSSFLHPSIHLSFRLSVKYQHVFPSKHQQCRWC